MTITADENATTSTEARDLLATLAAHRDFLRFTLKGMTDEQLSSHPTPSALCLGGLVKHLAAVERTWARFIVEGPRQVDVFDPDLIAAHQASFQMADDDTGGALLADYEAAGAETDALLASVDLDSSQRLPDAPWFPPDTRWTARRVALHLIAETAQHAGHADMIREAIDGQKTMG
jgi:uncharacterized damage-inducible protein DinB